MSAASRAISLLVQKAEMLKLNKDSGVTEDRPGFVEMATTYKQDILNAFSQVVSLTGPQTIECLK
eukprot:8361143-Karenia_brevis.AAC.1